MSFSLLLWLLFGSFRQLVVPLVAGGPTPVTVPVVSVVLPVAVASRLVAGNPQKHLIPSSKSSQWEISRCKILVVFQRPDLAKLWHLASWKLVSSFPRERIIHLLAVKPQRRCDIINRLKKGKQKIRVTTENENV